VDPGQAILADHDRLSRRMQRPADELTEVTISPRHGPRLNHRSGALMASAFRV
jgi:hypothetical protein